jgi:hypothetical protein
MTEDKSPSIPPGSEIFSGATYVADVAKRCMFKGCRAPTKFVVVAYNFDTRSWIHASVCAKHEPRARKMAAEASAHDAQARKVGLS